MAKNDSETDEEESQVFSANLGKDDNGLEIYDANANESESVDVVVDSEESLPTSEDAQNASTTEEELVDASTTNPEEILKQAGDLLDSDDISATLYLMDEAGQVINQIEENSGATSTDNLQGEALEIEESAVTPSDATNE